MKIRADVDSKMLETAPDRSQRKATKLALPLSPNGSLPPYMSRSTLTELECRELEHSEAIIQSGWTHFLEVGQALMKIQKSRLYRDGYATFELYCRDRLGISRPYAYNLIGSAEVFDDLSSIEDIPSKPTNEAQTRCLIGLPKANRIAAWQEALERAGGEPVTAKLVREVAVKFKQNKAAKPRLKSPAKTAVDGKPASNSILRLIDEAEEAVKAKDFPKAHKLFQRLRETFIACLAPTAREPKPPLDWKVD